VDALIVALDEWFVGTKAGEVVQYTESKMLSGDELGEYSQWPGAVYRLRFDLPRGVYELTFAGEGRPEGAFAGISNEARVHLAAIGDAPEVVPFPGETPP
jgi:hypothetical protein